MRRSTGAVEEQKVGDVNIDEFNTAALDDLLGGGAPQRSSDPSGMPDSGPGLLDTQDPFSGGNQFSDAPKQEAPMDDFFGGDTQANEVNDGGSIPLDELMGGSSGTEVKENVSQDDPVSASNPATGDLDKLKALYNTPAPQANPMGMGGQPGGFNTGMPMGGQPMGQPMGGMGMPMGG